MSTQSADDSTAPHTSLGPFSSPGASPTPWEATEWALRRIQKFQLCTVRRDGRPHVTPRGSGCARFVRGGGGR
jgi:hypothetical protein